MGRAQPDPLRGPLIFLTPTPLSIASNIHLPWVPKGEELGEQGFLKKNTVDLLLKLGATPLTTPGYFTPVGQDSDAFRLNPRQEIPGLSQ
jgi:hypothetical protein